MNHKNNVVSFPSQYQDEIKLAEDSLALITNRMSPGELRNGSAGGGNVASMIDAVGELLALDELEERGQHISQKKTEEVVSRLESAVGRLGSWPDLPRILAFAPLCEALEELELEWIVAGLLASLPDLEDLREDPPAEVVEALGRIAAVHLRIMMDDESWDPGFEAPLRVLREEARRSPDDDGLMNTLKRAVVYHMVLSRQALLEQDRVRMAEKEPLSDEFITALDEFQREISDSRLIRCGVHLVVADVLAAGLAPAWAKPKHIVAATELAIIEEDDPELSPDLVAFARWARLKPSKLAALRDSVAAALDWKPAEYEGSVEFRQERRWRFESGSLDFWPPRWTPAEDAPGRPPYSTEAAQARLEELRDVAWMMVDGMEAVRFVGGAFLYSEDLPEDDSVPEEMDVEIMLEAIDIWKAARVVEEESGHGDVEKEWQDDLDMDPGDDLPTLVTADGEPVVSCIGKYRFAKKNRAKVVHGLDDLPELERESDDASDRWVWLEDRQGQDLLIGSIEVEDDLLEVTTMSRARSERIGDRLAGHLGEFITMEDLETLPMTSELVARGATARQSRKRGEPAVPVEVEREVVQRALEQHYRRWPDEPVPALGGMTPREAVEDPEGRTRVVALLREFEKSQAAAPEAMKDFDFGFLWDDLGLNRKDD